MPSVRTDHNKIADLGNDDLRRLLAKAVNAWLTENEADLTEVPAQSEVADIVSDLVAVWEDAVMCMVETAVETELSGLIADEDDDEIDGRDVLEPEVLE